MRIVRRTLPVLAAVALALGVTACDPDNSLSSPSSLTTTPARMADAFPHYADPTTERPARHTSPPANPLSTNGRWKVPEQIPYGTYAVMPTDGMGYWEKVAVIGAEPGEPGWIGNDLVTGPDFVTIGQDVKYFKITDITLSAVDR